MSHEPLLFIWAKRNINNQEEKVNAKANPSDVNLKQEQSRVVTPKTQLQTDPFLVLSPNTWHKQNIIKYLLKGKNSIIN